MAKEQVEKITKAEIFELALVLDTAKAAFAYGEYVSTNLHAAYKAGCMNLTELQKEFDTKLAAYKKQETL